MTNYIVYKQERVDRIKHRFHNNICNKSYIMYYSEKLEVKNENNSYYVYFKNNKYFIVNPNYEN
tara:strand:+ start:50 stop:241 length:192 start_codon:yes stop_codon:yes gene_type:complete